jgi:GNAT superfamily N-acetyltransferase
MGEGCEMKDLPRVEPRHELTAVDTEWVDWRLYEHNIAKTGRDDWKALGFVLRDDTAAVVGAAYGYSWADIAELKQMWVAESHRGRGHARALLESFVAEAKTRGVRRLWVMTYDFQAPKMYEKFGFERMAELEGWPEGHSYIILCKRLDNDQA